MQILLKLEFGDFCGQRKTREHRKKQIGARRVPTTNSTPTTQGQNQTHATLLGGERPNHCAIPAPLPIALFAKNASVLKLDLS